MSMHGGWNICTLAVTACQTESVRVKRLLDGHKQTNTNLSNNQKL